MTWSKQQLLKMRRNLHIAAESLPDDTLVETPELAETWAYPVEYTIDKRVQFNGRLFKCRQAHASQSDWAPEVAVSLWEEVAKPGKGDSRDNPIDYGGNMELFEGKYYRQAGVVYICTRNSGQPMNHPLEQLIGLYVAVA